VLHEIRLLPGFEQFLAPRPAAELQSAAESGPVVLLSVASLRCDALILTPDRIDVLPLKGIDRDTVIKQTNVFLDAVHVLHNGATPSGKRPEAEKVIGAVLQWLGERVTGLVLDHLNYNAAGPEAQLPRVWWCPSGALALLPFHAAGHHSLTDGRSDAVIDRVVSSTIPSVQALLHARRAAPSPAGVAAHWWSPCRILPTSPTCRAPSTKPTR
jgi:hypothetical protein